MKRIWFLPVCLALVLVAVSVAGCTAENASPIEIEGLSINNQQEGIWVSGQGTTMVTPDIAVLSLGVEAQASNVAGAQSQVTVVMNEVMETLTDNGIAEEDIQTQYYNIRQVTKWDRDEEEEIVTGYRVTNKVSVKIREIDDAGAVIDAVVAAGGDLIRIDSIYFSIDDPSAYYEEARADAMVDAKTKAEQLADLAGAHLGKAKYISENNRTPPTVYRQGAVYEEAAPAMDTAISPGEIEVSLTIQINYALLY